MKAAVVVAFADRWAMGVGCGVALLVAGLVALGGQMLAPGASGIVLLATPGKAAIFAGLALLAGFAGLVQACAFRLRFRRAGGATAAAGIVLALVGASCCTPLLWPAALTLLGVSGVTLLGVNAEIHRWFWIPVVVSAAAFAGGTARALRAIAAGCRLDPPGRVASPPRPFPGTAPGPARPQPPTVRPADSPEGGRLRRSRTRVPRMVSARPPRP